MTRPDQIEGYTFGRATHSPVTLEELDLLERTMQWSDEDERYLKLAREVLANQAEAMVDAWRGVIASQPHLARYSAFPDGRSNAAYSAASKPRFIRWVTDVFTRPRDQAWLDYQQEIGLRHTREKKNRTDQAESAEHIPYRYFLAFVPVILLTTREFLGRKGHSAEDVERMHAAWTKVVLLHMTLWSRPYMGAGDW